MPTSFESKQVTEQTRAVFEIIASTRSDIINAKERRVALAKSYTPEELTEYDQSVKGTEATLMELEKLVEQVRIDLEHNNGKIRPKTRFVWAMQDSKGLSTASHNLRLARSRMSFATMMVHMRREHDRRESLSLSSEEIAPTANTTYRSGLSQDLEYRRSAGIDKIARSRSVNSDDEETNRRRPVPRARTITIPTFSREEELFGSLVDQHEQTQFSPPSGPLAPLPASVEARGKRYDPVPESMRRMGEQANLVPPARTANPEPSIPYSSLDTIPAVRMNNIHPQQRVTISPPITPPDSPYQGPIDPSLSSTSEPGVTTNNRSRVFSSMTLNPLPTVLETSSIRFELDATEEVKIPEVVKPVQVTAQIAPRVGLEQTATRSVITSQAAPILTRRVQTLPYPDDRPPLEIPHPVSENRATLDTAATSQPASIGLTDLKSTPYFFAGHRQPVNIRWLPEPSVPSQNETIRPPKRHEEPINRTNNSALEFMYQPYRPPQR